MTGSRTSKSRSSPRPRTVWRVLDAIEDSLALFSAGALLGLVVLISADVIGRRIFHWSMPWIIEIAEYYLLFATFMNSAWVLREGAHIQVDFFDNKLTERGRHRLTSVAFFVTLTTTVFVLFFSYRTMLTYLSRGSLQGNFIMTPQWIMFAPIPLGLSLFLMELFRKIRIHTIRVLAE